MTPLLEPRHIEEAWALYTERLARGGDPIRKGLGWQGGNGEYTLYWHTGHGIWATFESNAAYGYHSSGFGTEDPRRARVPTHVCAINVPKHGMNRRCAGLFVRDRDNVVYLAHSGKVVVARPVTK